MSSRRTFLRNLLVLSASGVLLPRYARAAYSALLQPAGRTPDAMPGAADFLLCRGATFSLQATDGSVQPVVLADVQTCDRGPALENFSLQFNGRADSAVPQGIHEFAHPKVGRFELFVVARRIDNQVVGYEAVINRLV